MKNIITFGDLILDKYIFCSAKKINSESPNIVFEEENINYNLGGVGNVAASLSNLNYNVFMVSVIGMNYYSNKLVELIEEKKNIKKNFLVNSNFDISVKKRYISNNCQVFRIDNGNNNNISEEIENLLIKNVEKIIKNNQIECFVISDYNKGVVTVKLVKKLIDLCKKNKIFIFVDPKVGDYSKFRGSNFIKPNRFEFNQICNFLEIKNKINSVNLGCICDRLEVIYLLITLDKDGMVLYNNFNKKITKYSVNKSNKVTDVTGAGDIVLISLVHFLLEGISIEENIRMANILSQYSVSSIGNLELDSYLVNKICFNSKLITDISLIDKSKKIIFTNGCFDILHTGHIEYLKKSRQLGDLLVIGLNSDNSIKKLKGKNRPINKQEDRVKILESFSFVDYIIIFNEETPYNLIKKLKPNVLVKGGDYADKKVIGSDIVEEVILMDFVDNYSSTNIINRIRSI